MNRRTDELGGISPFFIVSDVPRAVSFYEDRLGFDVRFLGPPNEKRPFFAIVGRGGAQLFLKAVSDTVLAQPNHSRHDWAPWDAFVYSANPDSLALELSSRGVSFHQEVGDREDGLRGFEVQDSDGYVLFFGRPR